MKKLLLLALAVALSFSLASAQTNKIVFGPLDGEGAGDIITGNGADVVVPVWIRTAPGINVVGFHWPLASNDLYVASRNGGALFDPFGAWDDVSFLTPTPDNVTPNFTNQSILGVKDLIGIPDPLDGIQTEGAWWMVAEYHMTTTTDNEFDTYCDAFVEGDDPVNHGMTWVDFDTGEMDQSQIEKAFACLVFSPNADPVWTVYPESPICADAGIETCFDLAGTDANADDDLHIVQTGGPGVYTEDVGGPGGVTSGTWCGTLTDDATLTFELRDNAGGVVPLVIEVTVTQIAMDMGECVDGVPGAMVVLPVYLHTCTFEMGGMALYIGWDPTALTFLGADPTGRIDYGNEFFDVNFSDPCEQCPDDNAVRITWISDINNGIPHDPAYPGDDPVVMLHFQVASGLPWGMQLPVSFLIPEYGDNTISDQSGYVWLRPALTDGCVNTVDPESYKGDPNMNGYPYEVGDAVLVARRLVYGYGVWSENGSGDDAIQEASADLNDNGFVDIADLIWFIHIITHEADPPKVEPVDANADISISSVIGDNIELNVSSNLDVGGVLLTIDHTGVEIGTPDTHGMDFVANDENGVLKIVVYSLEGTPIPAGTSNFLTIPVISNDNGSANIVEASTSDAYGHLLETTTSVEAPVPTQYAVKQNYPNPFNAKTLISFDLPQAGDVNVGIYNITGQLVRTLSGHFEAGTRSVTWDASDAASGVYFYKVTAGSFTQTMKMTLLK